MSSKQTELEKKLLSAGGVYLYGTTPPREGATREEMIQVARKLADRLRSLPLDGLVCYDIQEEGGRTAIPRPFPFMKTVDNRVYSSILREELNREVINYRCVVEQGEAEFRAWIEEAREKYGISLFTLVGGATSALTYGGINLNRACELIKIAENAGKNLLFGGVTIPERHARKGNEHLNLLRKSRLGMKFFISQAIYRPDAFIRLMQDYLNECDRQGAEPRKIILTFAPCGREKTLQFMQWLGIDFAEGVPENIFAAGDPLERSLRVCEENLTRILDAFQARKVSLGLNIESVSIFKAEIDASVELFHRLRTLLESRS